LANSDITAINITAAMTARTDSLALHKARQSS